MDRWKRDKPWWYGLIGPVKDEWGKDGRCQQDWRLTEGRWSSMKLTSDKKVGEERGQQWES